MSLIGVNVIYGLDTEFATQANASDSKTRFIETNYITNMKININNEGTTGSAFIYNDGISPYGQEVRVTQSPFALVPSDTN
jgi:hypothetical protein